MKEFFREYSDVLMFTSALMTFMVVMSVCVDSCTTREHNRDMKAQRASERACVTTCAPSSVRSLDPCTCEHGQSQQIIIHNR